MTDQALDANTRLAAQRTRLAYERTLMAWVRTCTSLIALIAFGFTIYQIFRYLSTSEWLRALLGKAYGDEAAYRDYRHRYRAMATSLGFEGHMQWAEAMP